MPSIMTFAPAPAKKKLIPPENDNTFFYTAGRLLSYFPNVNDNGVAFFREDCKHLIDTLIASTTDIEHVKPGYSVPALRGMKNTIMGAICKVHEDEEGIDIISKNELDVAKAMGFTPEDFAKGGGYATFSQECDHFPPDSSWIVVDKDDPSKVIKEISYIDGMTQGYRRSHVKDGKWDYFFVDGNPVYIRVRPLAFVGAGHVAQPADESAVIYAKLLSSKGLASFYPGMDDPDGGPPRDMVSEAGPQPGALGDDRNIFAQDFQLNPDLVMPSSYDPDADKDLDSHPDNNFAAVWTEPHPEKGIHELVKKRQLRIRDAKGKLDRSCLIAAYHALCGMRGNTLVTAGMPSAVQAHALTQVREGLNLTKPSTKEKSTKMEPEQLLAAERAKLAELTAAATAKETEIASLQAKITELSSAYEALKAEKEAAVAAKETEIASLKETVKSFKDGETAVSRLAELEAIHPLDASDKSEEFVKSLASLDEARFETLKLRREIAKRDAALKTREVASRQNADSARYIPTYKPAEGEKAPTVLDVL